MKFCEDCRWIYLKQSPFCCHPFAPRFHDFPADYCETVRTTGGCGPEGRWWEAKGDYSSNSTSIPIA